MKTPVHLRIAMLITALFSGLALAGSALAADAVGASGKAVAAETHEGYFVSNKFEPDAPMSFVIATDQAAFDKVFGVAMVMRYRSHRLEPDVFGKRIVVAAIHRGKAMVTYKVESANLDGKTLIIRYTTKSEPSTSAEFSCPLILSLPKGAYDEVRFIENGKAIKTVKTAPGTAFQIHGKNPGAVMVTGDDLRTVFTIQDARGIGSATIRREDGQWPQKVIVNAQLRSLEHFAITSGDVKLAASVLSHSGNRQLLHLWRGDKEGPQLTREGGHWMEIRTLDADRKPIAGLPPAGGCFEMSIPNALLAETKELRLDWIDFYR